MNPTDVARDVAEPIVNSIQRSIAGTLPGLIHTEVNSAQGTFPVLCQEHIPCVLDRDFDTEPSHASVMSDGLPISAADIAMSCPLPRSCQFSLEASARLGSLTKPIDNGRVAAVTVAQPANVPIATPALTTDQHKPTKANAWGETAPEQVDPPAGLGAASPTPIPLEMYDRKLVKIPVTTAPDAHGHTSRLIVHRRVVIPIAVDLPSEADELLGCPSPPPPWHALRPLAATNYHLLIHQTGATHARRSFDNL
jgi:hypothetical protein